MDVQPGKYNGDIIQDEQTKTAFHTYVSVARTKLGSQATTKRVLSLKVNVVDKHCSLWAIEGWLVDTTAP